MFRSRRSQKAITPGRVGVALAVAGFGVCIVGQLKDFAQTNQLQEAIRAPGHGEVILIGQVTSLSGVGLSGAKLVGTRTGGDHEQISTTTDSKGSYRLKALTGSYVLRASHGTLAPAERLIVAVKSGEHQWSFRLAPGARIRGVVADPDGRPQRGILVWAEGELSVGTGSLRVPSARTDVNGQFEISSLMPGVLTVCAQSREADACVQVRLGLGADVADVDLRLPYAAGVRAPGRNLQPGINRPRMEEGGLRGASGGIPGGARYGRVENALGEGLAGVAVELVSPAGARGAGHQLRPFYRVGWTDATGHVFFGDIPEGIYDARVFWNGVAISWALPSYKNEPRAPKRIEVGAEGALEHLIVESCEGSISGRAIGPTGSGIWVEAIHQEVDHTGVRNVVKAAGAEADGRFHIPDLCGGKYLVRATGLDSLSQAFVGGLEPGSQARLRLQELREVRCTVRQVATGEIEGARVEVTGPDGYSRRGLILNGSFQFWGVQGQMYKVSVDGSDRFGEAGVLVEEDTDDCEIVFRRGATVAGRMVSRSGEGLPGRVVALVREGPNLTGDIRTLTRVAETDSRGDFRFERVRQGSWFLSASHQQQVLFLEQIGHRRGEDAAGTIRLRDDDSLDLGEVTVRERPF